MLIDRDINNYGLHAPLCSINTIHLWYSCFILHTLLLGIFNNISYRDLIRIKMSWSYEEHMYAVANLKRDRLHDICIYVRIIL